MGQTVNLLAYAFGGSNPSLPTTNPVRGCKVSLENGRDMHFKRCIFAEVAQLIEQ